MAQETLRPQRKPTLMIEEVFHNLVDQFSDPFTCLRELVQNAMDAGTENVEVSSYYLDNPGGALLEVRDFGTGMNREAIDTKLTRLFASDKEDDLTKIGKFGIGFVSVFSLNPQLVIVDTGCDGEYWRIAFDGGTDFALFHLHEPIEGTSVRIYKMMDPQEYGPFETRAKSTIALWCRHSATTITFNGTSINSDLVVNSPVHIDRTNALGRFSLGLAGGTGPWELGLYNSGLTLIEGDQTDLPGVTFKIQSNHLEHTLTRDAVIKDANYGKVMKELAKLAENDLLSATFANLMNPETRSATARVARAYLRHKKEKGWSSTDKKKAIFSDILGNPVTLGEILDCAKSEDHLFVSTTQSMLAERAVREKIPVLPFEVASPESELLAMLSEVAVVLLEENLAVSRPVARPPGFANLESSLRSLLREAKMTITSVVPVEYPDSIVDPDAFPCIFALGADRLVRRYRKGYWATKYLLPQQLLLDMNHPLIRKALTRLENPSHCRTIAYAICKTALLNDGINPALENNLLETLLEQT